MDDLLSRTRAAVWHPCTQMKQLEAFPPLAIARGEGSWLIDTDGRRYLDAISSWWVNLFGHCNPRINAAITDQLGKIEHVMLAGATHEPVVALSERLAALTGLGHAFYGSDGASATEIALKMSAHYWRNAGQAEKSGFISLKNGYHGETVGALSVTDIPLFKSTYAPLLRQTVQVPTPDARLAEPGESAEAYALRCADALEAHLAEHAATTAALFVEPLVQGAAGMAMYHPVYLTRARELCTRYQVHLIADEIAVGFGRTGTMFACEQSLPPPPLGREAGGEGADDGSDNAWRFSDHPAESIEFAHQLRRNQTEAESLLWRHLRNRNLGYKFRRQHPMPPYTLDFFCQDAAMVIELDGGQHADSERDRRRDEWLAERGLRVLRFWNHEVLQDTESVLQAIWNALHEPARPHPQPISPGERGGTDFPLQGEGNRRPGDGVPGIRPDFICLSKGITGGYLPLSAVLCTDAVYDAFYDDDPARGFLHSHSYTGNALACRAALAVLDIFRDDDVIAANRDRAQRWHAAASPLAGHAKVRHFRQRGMIIAFDVETSRPDFARWCFAEGLARELLLRPIGSSVYFMPPYVLTDAEFALLVERTAEILDLA